MSGNKNIENIEGIKRASELINSDDILKRKFDKELQDEIYKSEILTVSRLSHLYEDFKVKKETRKPLIAKHLAILLSNQDLFDEYFESLDSERQKLLIKVTFSGVISKDEAYEGINLTCPEIRRDGYSYWSDYYDQDDEHFPYLFSAEFYTIKIELKVRFALRKLLEKHCPFKEYKTDELPEKTNLFTEEKGLEFFNNIHEIIGIAHNSGFFEREISQPILKKLCDQINNACQLSQFYSDFETKDVSKVKNVRLELILKFLAVVFKTSQKSEIDINALPYDSFELIKLLLTTFCNHFSLDFDSKYLVPNSSAYGYVSTEHEYDRIQNMKMFVAQFRFEKFKEFVPLSRFMYEYALTGVIIPGYRNQFKGVIYNDYQCKEYLWISDYDYFAYFVNQRSIANFILLMASLGLFEISYEVLDENDTSRQNLDKLWYYKFGIPSYVKFTDLGKAVFGITETFIHETKAQVEPPKLYENDYLININSDDKISPQFVAKWTKKISENLYILEKEKLRTQLKTRSEIDSFFSRLESITKAELPQIWQDLKSQFTGSFIHLNYSADYIVVDLKNQKPEIISLAKKLSSLKPEGYILMNHQKIAVKKVYLSGFIRTIEEAGFRIE